MYTINDIIYRNTKTGRNGLLTKVMKPEWIEKNIDGLNIAINKANSTSHNHGQKEWTIIVKYMPLSQSRDFQWRVNKEFFHISVCDKYDNIYSNQL